MTYKVCPWLEYAMPSKCIFYFTAEFIYPLVVVVDPFDGCVWVANSDLSATCDLCRGKNMPLSIRNRCAINIVHFALPLEWERTFADVQFVFAVVYMMALLHVGSWLCWAYRTKQKKKKSPLLMHFACVNKKVVASSMKREKGRGRTKTRTKKSKIMNGGRMEDGRLHGVMHSRYSQSGNSNSWLSTIIVD